MSWTAPFAAPLGPRSRGSHAVWVGQLPHAVGDPPAARRSSGDGRVAKRPELEPFM